MIMVKVHIKKLNLFENGVVCTYSKMYNPINMFKIKSEKERVYICIQKKKKEYIYV